MLPHATCHTAALATPSQPQAASFVCLFVCLLVCLACSFIWRALITRHAYAALPLASFIKKPKERRQSCPAPTPAPAHAPPAANPCQQQQQRSQAYAHNFRLAKFCLHLSKERKEAEGVGEGSERSMGRGTV